MNITRDIKTSGNIVTATVGVASITTVEAEQLTKFGQQKIDLGGDFTTSEDANFTLDTNERYMIKDMPFVQSFDFADYDDARLRAEAWADAIIVKVNAALLTLLAMSSPDSHSEIELPAG